MSYLQSSVDKKLYCNRPYRPVPKAGQYVQRVAPYVKEVVKRSGVFGKKNDELVFVPEKLILHNKKKRFSMPVGYQNIMMLHQLFLLRAGLITYDKVVKAEKKAPFHLY